MRPLESPPGIVIRTFMRIILRQFGAITWMTAIQALRQPVLLLVTVSGSVAMLLLPVLIAHQFGEDGKLVRDSALALYLMFGLPFCVFAADSLRRERSDGTASVTLSKAVRPELFFLAKYAGIALLTIGYATIMTATVILSDRIAPRTYLADLRLYYLLAALIAPVLAGAGIWNLLTRRSFCATAWLGWMLALLLALAVASQIKGAAGPELTFTRPLQWRIVPAGMMIGAALLVFAAVAATLSTHLKPVPAVVICFLVLLGGLFSDYLLGRFAPTSFAAATAYRMLPNWQHFWSADWLTGGGVVPAGVLVNCLIYAALYTSGVLALGVAVWRHTEIY